MNISKRLPQRGWALLTAILAAIAVIAALLAVPAERASAAEPTDFVPNTTLGNESKKEETNKQHFAADYKWGMLVWAGKPAGPGFKAGGYENNDVGWGWCLEPVAHTPLNTFEKYEKRTPRNLSLIINIMTS